VEELFRTLFESSPDAIFIEDPQGYVLDCNPAAAILHRTERTQLIGKHATDLVPPEWRDRVIISAEDYPFEFEGLSLTADGTSIPVGIRTSRIEYNGKPAILLNVRDITDRKRLEERLRASNDELELRVQNRTAALARANEILREEIAERNRAEDRKRHLEEQIQESQRMEAVGRLAGGVAHDFNNLLTVIIGRCEVMLDRLSGNHPMLPDVMLIHDAAHKAAGVTRQLLAFGRKQVLQPQVLDLNLVISNMKAIMLSLISENIQLRVTLHPATWRVEADRGQTEQVIMNLVVNAIDAMSKGGELEISTHNEDLEDLGSDFGLPANTARYAVLSVRDTGEGMSAETLSHIFEPFFTTKGDAKGTGLGLSTVYGIVTQSGGYIHAVSAPGQGSTFKVYLPGLESAADPLHVENKQAPRGIETILLAEDAHVVRKLTRELLENRGYRVIEAASGEEAVNICATYSGKIDLVLSDVIMAHMNGHEVAEQVVRIRPGVKVLLMSGYADEITRNQIARTGFKFIAKPFTSNGLGLKVREALDT
jgi:two-component system cell cycle sensor histidine kinase/response regulator CckA